MPGAAPRACQVKSGTANQKNRRVYLARLEFVPMTCLRCQDCGWVCEIHPDQPFGRTDGLYSGQCNDEIHPMPSTSSPWTAMIFATFHYPRPSPLGVPTASTWRPSNKVRSVLTVSRRLSHDAGRLGLEAPGQPLSSFHPETGSR
jgi:hypothetical protein